MILYQPPTLWGLFRGAAINLFLPFVNGLMLGFGELFAHELAFRLGWSATKVPIKAAVTSLTQCHTNPSLGVPKTSRRLPHGRSWS